MNAIVKAPPPHASGINLMPTNMDQAMRLAEIMSRTKMVPKHLQDDVGTCFMVVEQAARWNMSPFAVAQCTSNIGGKLMYEGKLVAAVASACNSIVGEFDYTFTGDPRKPDTLSVIASAVRASDGQRKEIELKWADAKTENQFWKKQPEQQLLYAAARVWCRRWSPGPMLGVYSPEEFDAPDTFRGTTVDAEPAPQRSPDLPHVSEPAPPPAEPKRTFRQVIDETAGMLTACDTMDAVVAIADLPQVRTAIEKGSVKVQNEMKALLADAFERVRAIADDTAEAEEPFPGDTPLEHAEAATNSA